MCEGWGGGKVHWQITREGKVRLGIASRDNKPHTDYDTPALFTPERFGRWMHLTVVHMLHRNAPDLTDDFEQPELETAPTH